MSKMDTRQRTLEERGQLRAFQYSETEQMRPCIPGKCPATPCYGDDDPWSFYAFQHSASLFKEGACFFCVGKL